MSAPVFERRLLAPKFWPAWAAALLLLLLAWLPWRLQLWLGQGIGLLVWALAQQRRNDTLINLQLCFPEHDAATRERMARDVFMHTGISLFETANAWFRPLPWLFKTLTVEGLEHLRAAEAQGRGVLLLGAHYTSLDLAGALCSQHFQIDTVYRPQNNAALDYLTRWRRARIYLWQIDHGNMRQLFKALKASHNVWYTPDQDFGIKQGVFAPFFGINAATVTATARLAKVNQSAVLFIHFCRRADNRGYIAHFTPTLEHYPSGDEVADATRINQNLELLIRRAPTQYMWFHRRFKTRPAGELPPYAPKRNSARKQRRRAARAAKRAAEKPS